MVSSVLTVTPKKMIVIRAREKCEPAVQGLQAATATMLPLHLRSVDINFTEIPRRSDVAH